MLKRIWEDLIMRKITDGMFDQRYDYWGRMCVTD